MGDALTPLDLVGVTGALLICAAYLAASVRRVDPEGCTSHGANAPGSTLLLVSLWFRPTPGASVIEALWLSIALFTLGRLWLRRRWGTLSGRASPRRSHRPSHGRCHGPRR